MRHRTIAALATPSVATALPVHDRYRYCPTPECPVVYYDDAGTVVERTGVRVPVSAKDPGPDVPLCYCFGHTRRAIAEEIATRGSSTVSTAIAREIKAGRCACEVKNPSGRCCLADVRSYEKEAMQERIGTRPSDRGDSSVRKQGAERAGLAPAGRPRQRGRKR